VSRILSSAQSIVPLSMINGGANRIVVSWVSLARIPFSRRISQYFLALPASLFNSTPINKPFDRISFIFDEGISYKKKKKYSPRIAAFSIILSSISTRRADLATAAPSGFPPNVEPCSPGVNKPRIATLDRTAETG